MPIRIRSALVLAALCAPLSKAHALNDPMFCGISYDVLSSSETSLQVRLNPKAAGAALPYTYHWDFGDGATSASRDAAHTYPQGGTYFVALTVDAVGIDLSGDPSDVRLELAGTNPSTRETRLAFDLPRSGRARVTIVDLAGRRVAALLDDERPAGRHVVSWSGLTETGSAAAGGMYLAVLEYEDVSRAIRIVRLR